MRDAHSTAPSASRAGLLARSSGRLVAGALAELLHALAKRPGEEPVRLELTSELGRGSVSLIGAQIVDAQCGVIVGEGAALRLLMAESGTYRITYGAAARARARRLDAPARRVLAESASFRKSWRQLAGARLPPATRLSVDRGRLERARDGLDLEALSLLARLNGKKPLIDIVGVEDPDAARQFERLREFVRDGLVRAVSMPAAVRESTAMSLTRTLPALALQPDAMAKIYARHVLVGNSPVRTLVRASAVALMISTLFLGVARGHWELTVGGQLMGWALLVLGHSVTRRPELMYTFPSALLLEPVLFCAEALERLGVRGGFIARGRTIARQALSSTS